MPRFVLWQNPRQLSFEGIRFDKTLAAQTFGLVMVGHNREVDRQNMGPADVQFRHTVISGIQDDASGPKFCLTLNGYNISVRDSWIGHCKQREDESKAISIQNLTGAEIINNYISGASINLLTAGGDSAALDVNRNLVI